MADGKRSIHISADEKAAKQPRVHQSTSSSSVQLAQPTGGKSLFLSSGRERHRGFRF